MTKPKQPITNREQFISWLHIGAPAIVRRTKRAVDGATLPYTAAMLERRAARLAAQEKAEA